MTVGACVSLAINFGFIHWNKSGDGVVQLSLAADHTQFSITMKRWRLCAKNNWQPYWAENSQEFQPAVCWSLKQTSHGKLKLANSCWQTQVGVCERRKNSRQTRSVCRQQFANVFADHFCAVHTHQLEFVYTSLPILVCRVKAALRYSTDISMTNYFIRNWPYICTYV